MFFSFSHWFNWLYRWGAYILREAAEGETLEPRDKLQEQQPLSPRAHQNLLMNAVKEGDIEKIQRILETMPILLIELSKEKKVLLLREAAKNGKVQIFTFLEQKIPGLVKGMIYEGDFSIFRLAAVAGQLDILNDLDQKFPRLVTGIIHVTGTDVCLTAAQNGHLEVLRYVEQKAPACFLEIIEEHHTEMFKGAVIGGHLSILNYLEAWVPQKLQAMISANKFDVFIIAAREGHLDVLAYLESKAPDLLSHMVRTENFWPFIQAAQAGHLEVLKYLESKAPDVLQDMIQAWNFSAFTLAAKGGHLEILYYLETKMPSRLREMIRAGNFWAFSLAAQEGHLEVLSYLEKKSPSAIEHMIESRNFLPLSMAAKSGHLAVVKFLVQKAPSQVKNKIQDINFDVWIFAAQGGHLEMLMYFEQMIPDIWEKMVQAENYSAFNLTTQNGHLDVLKYLVKKVPDALNNMMHRGIFSGLAQAISAGYLGVLKYYDQIVPGAVARMIKVRGDDAFVEAAQMGHLDVLMYLEEKIPGSTRMLFSERNLGVIRHIAENGHLEVLKYLALKLQGQFQDRVFAESFVVFRLAAQRRHSHIINYFLSFVRVLDYAESHLQAYGAQCVEPYIRFRCCVLLEQKLAFLAQYPHDNFNIDDAEAESYRIVLRYLIRRNTQETQADEVFLLEIPAIQAIATTNNNELIRLAIELGHREAITRLMRLPSVRALALANEMYRENNHRGLDLAVFVQNRESSMTALTDSEHARLSKAIDVYEPTIRQQGAGFIIETLKNELKTRFLSAPAFYHGRALPFTWRDLVALGLHQNPEVLKNYYRHPSHTAHRYLSKPNEWMHPQAEFVEVVPGMPHERWARFDGYTTLIAMLYLAVKDERYPPIEGHTYASRMDIFVGELAMIARAHNWDKARKNEKGNWEEYDDLEGDRPSCYSGTKRRLFQACLGHPLFKILTQEDVYRRAIDFYRAHIQALMENPRHRAQVRLIWMKLIEFDDLTDDEQSYLKAVINISIEQRERFIELLISEYGVQFDDYYQHCIRVKFSENDNHLQQMGTHVMQIIETIQPEDNDCTGSKRLCR